MQLSISINLRNSVVLFSYTRAKTELGFWKRILEKNDVLLVSGTLFQG